MTHQNANTSGAVMQRTKFQVQAIFAMQFFESILFGNDVTLTLFLITCRVGKILILLALWYFIVG